MGLDKYQHCPKHFTNVNFLKLYNNLMSGYYYHPHFKEETTGALSNFTQ